MTTAQGHHIIRLLTVAAFVVALVCVLAPTTVFGAGWPAWTIGGLMGIALDRVDVVP